MSTQSWRSTQIPTGTVTFAFTDIEGSTQRWDRKFSAMEQAVRRHDDLVRAAITDRGGYVFKALGDAFCAAFSRPEDAVAAMLDVQRLMAAEDFSALDGLRVRAAIHTGTASERDGDYFGPSVNRVARLLATGHGGQILLSRATKAVVESSLPEQTSLRDLGEHRLRDLSQPEHVYTLAAPGLATEFPPLRSLSALSTNLPLQLTSFVGREKEIDEITSLVQKNRLVTLVGSGGVGKTRTALQVAANVLDSWEDGVWFIELAPLSHGDHIAPAITQTLGISADARDPLQGLVDALKPKKAMLIFDNCEHLVDSTSRTIAALLRNAPNLSVLASSRQVLDVAGEQSYRLPSLEVPDTIDGLQKADAMRSAAVVLFAERAAAVERRFVLTDENVTTVAEICRRLDGIPLAIELAASRMSMLTLSQLSAMLDERFRLLVQKGGDRLPRQQTLRALIDWSYDLLDDNERAVFRRLSVFSGGWGLDAAAAICSDERIDEWQVFELLSGLVTKSLVVAEPGGDERRFRMLDSIREYSRDRLAEADEGAAVDAKHGYYYADLLQKIAPLVESLEDVQWQRALVPELANIRAALDWAESNDPASSLNLLSQLEWPELLTTPQEAIAWFDAAAEHNDSTADDSIKARVLRHRVRLEWLVGRPMADREKSANDAIEVARTAGDPSELARALANLASCYRDAGRFDEAEATFLRAYQYPESLSRGALNHVLRTWAVANLQHGDIDNARRRFTEVAERERPGSEAYASALLNIGELEFAMGNIDAARLAASKARETLAHLRAAPLALALCNLAAYAMAVDDLAYARDLLGEALPLLKRSGARWMITALEHHALLGALQSDCERASVLLGFTHARHAKSGKRERTEQRGYERLMLLLSQTYDEEELNRRLNEGARLHDDRALEYAAAISSGERPTR